ncbi:MAG: TonB-dependent receptor [Vicinamibacterales bacterium]
MRQSASRHGTARQYAYTAAASLILILLWSVPTGVVSAQSESGSAAIAGTARDPTGDVVPGVTLTARHVQTGAARTVVTDTAGRFNLPAMPVGPYVVEATLQGFATIRYEGIVLSVGETERLSLALTPAGVSELVTVTADVARIDRAEGATGTIISERAIADLPLRGRNFTEFVQLSPTVVQESDRFGLVISGQRSINSNVAIDGADFNDPLQGNQRGGNETAFFFPQSAVREFQVVRSGAGAEVGRTGAGFVNVVTRSGTNRAHGDAFYFNRNKALTSRDAFDRKLDSRQNQLGGSLGGTLRPNRVFFFGAAEQSFLRVPFVVKFQQQAPGVVAPAEFQALEGEQHGTNNPTALFGRLDAVLSSRQTLNIQPMYTRLTGENFNFDSPQSDSAVSANYTRRATSGAVKASLTSVFTERLLSDIRIQVATDDRLEDPNSRQAQISITGFGTVGGDSGRPRRFDARRTQVTQNLSWTTAGHHVRFGWDVNLTHFRQERESNVQGRYDFTSLANYAARTISRYRQTVAGFDAADLTFEGAGQEAAAFVQDRIDLSARLTLNAGLRWEGQWNPQPTRPNPAFPETATIPNDVKMWQPRLGLTWDTSGNGRTIVRLSSGLFASRTPANLFQRVYTDNGITTVAVDSRIDPTILTKLTFPNPLPLLPAGTVIPAQRVFGFDPDFQNPRTFQGALTLEQQLDAVTQVSVGYVYAKAWHLQRRLDRNLFPPTPNAAGLPIYPATRPNPTIAQLSINESTARSRYDALTLSMTRRMSRRIEAQVHYTLAYNKDDDSNERNFSRETTLNVFDPGGEWTWSKQDVRHNINASTVVDLPAGFTASAILFARSGFPFTPVIGTDQQRDLNDDNDRAIIDGKVAERNGMRQPGFFDLDLRLVKALNGGNGRRVDLVVEVFNATRASNRNFANDAVSVYGTPAAPVATAGQPLFAPSTARFGGPRQLQLGLRMKF